MAIVTKKQVLTEKQFGGVPYGNKTTLPFTLKTTAAGSMVGADSAAAIGVGDVARFGVLPAGMLLANALAIVSDAFTATSTAKIGFAYVDGVDDAGVPQDNAYFFNGLDLATAARAAQSTAKAPITLPKDAYLILTNQVAAQAAVGQLDVFVDGVLTGTA